MWCFNTRLSPTHAAVSRPLRLCWSTQRRAGSLARSNTRSSPRTAATDVPGAERQRLQHTPLSNTRSSQQTAATGRGEVDHHPLLGAPTHAAVSRPLRPPGPGRGPGTCTRSNTRSSQQTAATARPARVRCRADRAPTHAAVSRPLRLRWACSTIPTTRGLQHTQQSADRCDQWRMRPEVLPVVSLQHTQQSADRCDNSGVGAVRPPSSLQHTQQSADRCDAGPRTVLQRRPLLQHTQQSADRCDRVGGWTPAPPAPRSNTRSSQQTAATSLLTIRTQSGAPGSCASGPLCDAVRRYFTELLGQQPSLVFKDQRSLRAVTVL